MTYDFVIVGGGLIGSAIARELARYDYKTAILEKNLEVGCEVTKGTHAIVHVGLSFNRLTPIKNRCEFTGAAMMEQLCRDLDVKYQRVGKLGVAFSDDQVKVFEKMTVNARRQGVFDAEMIYDKGRLAELEPNLNSEVTAALYTKNTAVVSPWGLVYGFIENAMANGVELFTECRVNGLVWDEAQGQFRLDTSCGEFSARNVVNASGADSARLASLVGDDSFAMKTVRQQKVIIDNNYGSCINHVIRTLNAKNAMGDFICPTVYGDLMAGVDLSPVPSMDDAQTTQAGVEEHIIKAMNRLVPCIPPTAIIRPFSGVIAQTVSGEYVIRPAKSCPHFFNCVVGGSGLTSALPAAQFLVQEIMPQVLGEMPVNGDFDPLRKDMPHIHDMGREELAELIARDPAYGHVICRCETVSEGEIVEAIRRGARSVDGVKFRTRAGMGRCQGGFCGPRVIAILSRELGIAPEEVTKKGGGSYMVIGSNKRPGGEA